MTALFYHTVYMHHNVTLVTSQFDLNAPMVMMSPRLVLGCGRDFSLGVSTCWFDILYSTCAKPVGAYTTGGGGGGYENAVWISVIV